MGGEGGDETLSKLLMYRDFAWISFITPKQVRVLWSHEMSNECRYLGRQLVRKVTAILVCLDMGRDFQSRATPLFSFLPQSLLSSSGQPKCAKSAKHSVTEAFVNAISGNAPDSWSILGIVEMKFRNIAAVYLKNFKCYQGINECPVFLDDCESLVAYLGDNGTGKSAILEGLDAYFSKRPRWMRNK